MTERARDDSDDPGDRRSGIRHLACVVANMVREGGSARTAVIRDISATGARLLTRTRLTENETVRLSLFLRREEGQTIEVLAKVVRFEKLPLEQSELWSHVAAVHFDSPLEHLEPELKALAEHQAQTLGNDP